MTLSEFVNEIRASMESYDSAGLIDDISIINWSLKAVKIFGANVMELHNTVIDINKGVGKLPTNFYSLYSAYICGDKWVEGDTKDGNEAQTSIMWKETITNNNSNIDICNNCSKEFDSESIVSKKVYIGSKSVDVKYVKKELVSISKSLNSVLKHKDCKNTKVRSSNEIVIRGKTVYTSWDSGDLYIEYYGLELDTNGDIILPDSPKGEVLSYIEYYVKMKLIENLMLNNDSNNLITMFNYYVRKEESQKGLALTDSKFSKLTPSSFNRVKRLNKSRMNIYNL